jgi:hypothetical protein
MLETLSYMALGLMIGIFIGISIYAIVDYLDSKK